MKKQTALILRYVGKNDINRQKFVSFLEFKNAQIDVGLYQTINEFLGSGGLNILDCRGQGYDGADAVAGKKKALQTQVPRINSKALYTH